MWRKNTFILLFFFSTCWRSILGVFLLFFDSGEICIIRLQSASKKKNFMPYLNTISHIKWCGVWMFILCYIIMAIQNISHNTKKKKEYYPIYASIHIYCVIFGLFWLLIICKWVHNIIELCIVLANVFQIISDILSNGTAPLLCGFGLLLNSK